MKKSTVCLVILLGLILGVGIALAWYFGFVPYVREMIPFALAFMIILFFVTAVLRARCGNTGCERHACMWIFKLSPFVLIASAVFILFGLLILATYFSFPIRAVLAFVGSLSFYSALSVFIVMVLSRPRRIC